MIDALQERVSIDPDPQGLPPLKWTWGGRVTIHTKSGQAHASVVDASRGSGPRGVRMERNRLQVPRADAGLRLPSGRIEQSLDAIKRLDEAAGVTPLLALLQ